VWIATDHERIASEVERFGGEVVMTSPDCANGTERCAEAAGKINCDAEIIVNLQGDAPLTPHFLVPNLVERLRSEPASVMATPGVRCSATTLAHLRADESAGLVGGTTVVFSRSGRALYFSKRILPFLPPQTAKDMVPVHLHLGLYAYRRSALADYVAAGPSPLEQLEGLEQLRFLDLDLPVAVVASDPVAWDPIELNNPSDVAVVERILIERGIA
jgi:3-deoxy-manno-octulosonate cytidylyltransferase (CMP-KDO synthetase)